LLEQNDEWQLQSRYAALEPLRALVEISPLGCPPWSTEHEFNRAKTHDSYTASGDTILKFFGGTNE